MPISIPKGYQQVMPYLIIENAGGLQNYLERVFGAQEVLRIMRDGNKIMHGQVSIGECAIMFADATDQYKPITAGLFIYVENADAVYQKALAEGATSISEPANQDYGRSCGVTDPYGNTWWITSVQ